MIGYRDDAAKLREFHLQFSEKAPTRKELAGEFRSLREKLFIHMRMNAFDNFFDPSERDMPLIADYKRVFGEAAELLMYDPDKPIVVKGLVDPKNAKDRTSVYGTEEDARRIAGKSLELVDEFSRLVFARSTEGAYELCSSIYRETNSLKRFESNLKSADRKFGFQPAEQVINLMTWIYASEVGWSKPNANGKWPKETPKDSKRCLLGGWWQSEELGRTIFYWVVEEESGYRIAKFQQSRG